jgi:VanZ family protein
LFACFLAVLVSWMSFAFGVRELRRDTLIMLETHIVMSSLISCLVLTLVFHLILTLMLRLALLLVLCLVSFMDLATAHMVLVHGRIALYIDTLVTAHVLIVGIVSCIGMVFLLESLTPSLSPDTWTVHVFCIVVPIPLVERVRSKKL